MKVGMNEANLNIPVFNLEQRLGNESAGGALERISKKIVQSAEAAEENREEIQKLMEEIKRKFDMLNKYLRIDIDTELEIPVAKIIERDTNRVVRQIPPDHILELMKRIDRMLGILLNKEV
ncbi:MAG: flagellar biosynthesis protein FlaG [Acidobacteria bacterium]|jgi:flagellar protein FlaG|nr:MAG: flagellar biosynthesis protein FlaG [Acidobacteriota bacterium]